MQRSLLPTRRPSRSIIARKTPTAPRYRHVFPLPTRFPSPLGHEAAGIWFAAVRSCNDLVKLAPAIELGCSRIPHERGVICFSGRDDPTWLAHAFHLLQHTNGVLNMLNELVTEDDVEGVAFKRQVVRIAYLICYIVQVTSLCYRTRLLQDRFSRVDTNHAALRRKSGKVSGDCTWAAAEIEDAGCGLNVWNEEGGAVGCCTAGMRGDNTGMMAVGVRCLFRLGHFERPLLQIDGWTVQHGDATIAAEGVIAGWAA